MNLGSHMIQKAEEVVREKGGKSISLHAQCRVRAFYEKLGFCGYGAEDEDEGWSALLDEKENMKKRGK